MSIQVKAAPADPSILLATVVGVKERGDSLYGDDPQDFPVFDIEPMNCTRDEFVKRLRSMDQSIAEQEDGMLVVTDSTWFRIEEGEIISIAFSDYLETVLERLAKQAREELTEMADGALVLLDELSREAQ